MNSEKILVIKYVENTTYEKVTVKEITIIVTSGFHTFIARVFFY